MITDETKTTLPPKPQGKTRETVSRCPHCLSADLVKDNSREELYCNNCGLVLYSAVQWNGLTKVENIVPYSTPFMARDGVHTRWIGKDRKGTMSAQKHTRYTHTMSDKYLMRFGRRRYR